LSEISQAIEGVLLRNAKQTSDTSQQHMPEIVVVRLIS
jgi:hypothetical protein